MTFATESSAQLLFALAGRAMISTGWISATWTLFHFHVGLAATEHRARPRECRKMKFEVHCGDVCVYGYIGTFWESQENINLKGCTWD